MNRKYGYPIMKKDDYCELTKEELLKHHPEIRNLGKPDTENGKYVMLNIKGIFKFVVYKTLCNDLWLFFADGISSYIGHPKFDRKTEFIECLIRTQNNYKFKKFERIIHIALDNPKLLFKHKYNFEQFLKLSLLYGEIYGFYEEVVELNEKPFEEILLLFFKLIEGLIDVNKIEIT